MADEGLPTKTTPMRSILKILFISFLPIGLHAQNTETVLQNIVRQVRLFPQEKTYLRTDRECYYAGDRVWLRAFVVNALSHEPSPMSHYVDIDVIGPDSIPTHHVRLRKEKGCFCGFIDLSPEAPKGRYLLRCHTKLMANTANYESVKSIFVGGLGELRPPRLMEDLPPQPTQKHILQVAKNHGNLVAMLSPTVETDSLTLLAHCRAYPFYLGPIDREHPLVVREDSVPQGILSFLLLNNHRQCIDELSVWSNCGQEECAVQLLPDKQQPSSTDSTTWILSAPTLRQDEELEVCATLAEANTTEKETMSDIRSHLFFDTDMSGTWELPAYALTDGCADNLLVECHWQRYNLPQVLQGHFVYPKVAAETSATIEGRLTTLTRHRPVIGGSVNMIVPRLGLYAATKTDSLGHFCFENMDFAEGTQYVLNGFSATGSPHVALSLDESTYPAFEGTMPPYEWNEVAGTPLPSANDKAQEADIVLADVEVKAERRHSDTKTNTYAQLADFSFGVHQIEQIGATCLHEVLRRIPGVVVDRNKCYIRGAVSIYGDMPAAIVVDGVFVSDDYDLDNIQMQDVARVDIFKTGSTVIWGARGGMGVVSITTKEGNYATEQHTLYNTRKYTAPGYQPQQAFKPTTQTLCWLPTLHGRKIKLTLPARWPGYRLTIEGVTTRGRLVHFAIEQQ